MNELLSDNLWPTIKRLAKKSSTLRAAVAYVTSEKFVRFDDGDVLVTDASDHSIAAGQTNAKILARAFQRGTEIHSLPGLHAKVLLLGGKVVIGSANLSEASATGLVEAAWVTDTPAAVGMATSLVQQLISQAEVVDKAFIQRILKIKVKVRPNGAFQSGTPRKVKVPKHRSWIIGLHPLVRDFRDEAEAIEAGTKTAQAKISKASSNVSWIRFGGNSRFRHTAKEGDTVLRIWSPRRKKKPTTVFRHTPILHRQNETNCTRFFIEEFADCEETSMTWARFQKLVCRVGLSGKVGPASARPIEEAYANALFALWES